MDLDDLKNTWESANTRHELQPLLTPQTIDQMTQTKYNASLKRIVYPEIIGTVLCFMGAAYIGLNFNKLDTSFLQGTGMLAIPLLLVLPIISLLSLRQLNRVGDVTQTYAAALKNFAIQKRRFHQFQRLNLTLSYLLLVTVIILISKFFGGNDITSSKYFWTFSFCLGYIFLLFYSKWVFKYYQKTLQQAEELLVELES